MDQLNDQQIIALAEFRKAALKPIDPFTQEQLFKLYFGGHTLQEIADTDLDLTLGSVVDACVRYKWEDRRADSLGELAQNSAYKYAKASSETVAHLSIFLMAVHKNVGDKLKKYLETGDEEFVKDIDLRSFKTYKEAVETLQSITGVSPAKNSTKTRSEPKEVKGTTEKASKKLDAQAILELQGGSDDEESK